MKLSFKVVFFILNILIALNAYCSVKADLPIQNKEQTTPSPASSNGWWKYIDPFNLFGAKETKKVTSAKPITPKDQTATKEPKETTHPSKAPEIELPSITANEPKSDNHENSAATKEIFAPIATIPPKLPDESEQKTNEAQTSAVSHAPSNNITPEAKAEPIQTQAVATAKDTTQAAPVPPKLPDESEQKTNEAQTSAVSHAPSNNPTPEAKAEPIQTQPVATAKDTTQAAPVPPKLPDESEQKTNEAQTSAVSHAPSNNPTPELKAEPTQTQAVATAKDTNQAAPVPAAQTEETNPASVSKSETPVENPETQKSVSEQNKDLKPTNDNKVLDAKSTPLTQEDKNANNTEKLAEPIKTPEEQAKEAQEQIDTNKFIVDEVAMLILPKDDISLGHITFGARATYADDSEYIQMFWNSFNKKDSISANAKMNNYIHKVKKTPVTIGDIEEAKQYSLEAAQKGDINSLRAILNHSKYNLVNILDSEFNLLEEASASNQYDSTYYLLMRGANISNLSGFKDNEHPSPSILWLLNRAGYKG